MQLVGCTRPAAAAAQRRLQRASGGTAKRAGPAHSSLSMHACRHCMRTRTHPHGLLPLTRRTASRGAVSSASLMPCGQAGRGLTATGNLRCRVRVACDHMQRARPFADDCARCLKRLTACVWPGQACLIGGARPDALAQPGSATDDAATAARPRTTLHVRRTCPCTSAATSSASAAPAAAPFPCRCCCCIPRSSPKQRPKARASSSCTFEPWSESWR